MTLAEYVEDYTKELFLSLRWHLKYNNIINLMFQPWRLLMSKERGTTFPYYFTNAKYIRMGAGELTELLDDFIHYHEPERDTYGSFQKNFANRLSYVFKNIHYYSNETMSNLFFSRKLPLRDYQRLKHTFNHQYFTWFAYNSLSGVFVVALTNYFFRTRRTSLPMVFVASLFSFGLFAANFKLSRYVLEASFNNNCRRLGYSDLTTHRGTQYPRNVDFIAQ
jgi:hypothetical protein